MDAVNEAYKEFFPEGLPPVASWAWKTCPSRASVMIDAIFGNFEGYPAGEVGLRPQRAFVG